MVTLTIGSSGAEMGTFRSLVCMSDAIEKNILDLNLLKEDTARTGCSLHVQNIWSHDDFSL